MSSFHQGDQLSQFSQDREIPGTWGWNEESPGQTRPVAGCPHSNTPAPCCPTHTFSVIRLDQLSSVWKKFLLPKKKKKAFLDTFTSLLHPIDCFFCKGFAHILHLLWFSGWTEHIWRTPLSLWNGVITACLEFPWREQLTFWTRRSLLWMQLPPKTRVFRQEVWPLNYLCVWTIPYSLWPNRTLFLRIWKPQSTFETPRACLYSSILLCKGMRD